MTKVKFVLCIAFFTLVSHAVDAQNWELGLGLNAMNYQGDVVQTSAFTLKETQPNFSIFARHNFEGEKFALRLGLNLGKLSGNDANFTEKKFRSFNFKTPLTELAATLEWQPLSLHNVDGTPRKATPYFLGGLGLAFTNPTVFFNENSASVAYAKSGIATDKAKVTKTALVIPLGAGFKFALPKGTLGVELGLRATTSDYIDGISQAANPNRRDWYAIGGINYAFSFGGTNNRTYTKKGKTKDTDKDGVVDEMDKCPELPGQPANKGCPDLSPADQKTITEAIANVNFKTASAELTSESLLVLDKVADVLTRNAYYKVSIEGHTDAQGKAESNLTLSKARAASCVTYLLSKGITANRMTSDGFGLTRPIGSNDTEEGRRKNRRVEFNLSVN
jgi:outer membrane protein OmpA-like peptidoglycan-associated protein